MRLRVNERGEIGIWAVIASAVILLIVAAIGIKVFTGASGVTTAQRNYDQAQNDTNRFVQTANAEAMTAHALFIPSKDINGAANGYAFGTANPLPASVAGGVVAAPATTAHEFDYYAKDAQHQGHFWAYILNNGVLSKYSYNFRDAAGNAQGVSAAPLSVQSMASFKAYYLYASQIPSVNAFVRANYGAGVADVLKQVGFPEVYAGNRIVAIDLQALPNNVQTARHLELVAGGGVLGSSSVTTVYTPPPSGALGVDPRALSFTNPNDTTPTATYASGAVGADPGGVINVAEANYHRHFPVSAGCNSAASLVGNFSGSTLVGTTSAAGETGSFQVQPLASLTSTQDCTFTVSSQDQGPVTISVHVTVPPLVITPNSMAFANRLAPAQGFTMSETGWSGAVNATASTCAGIAAYPGTVSMTNGSASGSISPVNAGSCSITYTGGWGQSATLSITVGVLATPTPTPTATPTPTPAPSPTPTLSVIPAAVKYAASGTSLAYSRAPMRDFGAFLNAILGGGVAEAYGAGNCPAIAYTSSSFSTIVSGQTATDLGVDPGTGCYDGHVQAREGSGAFGGTFTYNFNAGGCNAYLTTGAWSGNTTISPDNLPIYAGSTAGSCIFTVSDNNSVPQSANVAAQVVATPTPTPTPPPLAAPQTISGTYFSQCSYDMASGGVGCTTWPDDIYITLRVAPTTAGTQLSYGWNVSNPGVGGSSMRGFPTNVTVYDPLGNPVAIAPIGTTSSTQTYFSATAIAGTYHIAYTLGASCRVCGPGNPGDQDNFNYTINASQP